MNIEPFKKRLALYTEKDIIFTDHAKLKAWIRGIDLEEIVTNILRPTRLKHVEEEIKNKFVCWFEYSGTLGHKYIIVLNGKALVVTVIKVRRRWQKRVEKHAKKF